MGYSPPTWRTVAGRSNSDAAYALAQGGRALSDAFKGFSEQQNTIQTGLDTKATNADIARAMAFQDLDNLQAARPGFAGTLNNRSNAAKVMTALNTRGNEIRTARNQDQTYDSGALDIEAKQYGIDTQEEKFKSAMGAQAAQTFAANARGNYTQGQAVDAALVRKENAALKVALQNPVYNEDGTVDGMGTAKKHGISPGVLQKGFLNVDALTGQDKVDAAAEAKATAQAKHNWEVKTYNAKQNIDAKIASNTVTSEDMAIYADAYGIPGSANYMSEDESRVAGNNIKSLVDKTDINGKKLYSKDHIMQAYETAIEKYGVEGIEMNNIQNMLKLVTGKEALQKAADVQAKRDTAQAKRDTTNAAQIAFQKETDARRAAALEEVERLTK